MAKNKVMEEVLGDTPDLTVSDLYSTDFPIAFRGYDKGEVRAFLERAADSFDVLQRHLAALQETVEKQNEQLNQFKIMEHALAESLANARRSAEITLDQARREAKLIVEETRQEQEAAKIKSAALPEALRDEIGRLQAMRKRLKSDLRAVLDIHAALLRDDTDSSGEPLSYLPADGSAYLDATARDGRGADVSTIESETESADADLGKEI